MTDHPATSAEPTETACPKTEPDPPASPSPPRKEDQTVTDQTPDPAITLGRYYPDKPPALPGETPDQYTDRLTGADRTNRRPYDHPRNRQCSIGYHDECSDPDGERCKCPCHTTPPGMPRHDDPEPFLLVRDEDVSGISGTGVVAQGVEFADGVVALRWLGQWPTSTAFHELGIESVKTIHGHGGKTRIVWTGTAAVAPEDLESHKPVRITEEPTQTGTIIDVHDGHHIFRHIRDYQPPGAPAWWQATDSLEGETFADLLGDADSIYLVLPGYQDTP